MTSNPTRFDDVKLGCLLIITPTEVSALPLQNTDVRGTITGPVASVRVAQRFGNPFKTPIDLDYLFPLPHDAAVVDYEIQIGARTIRADLKEREAAQQAYEKAVEAGQRASLLEERRADLFSIRVGNVQPGEAILTTLTYERRLRYSDGRYEFVFPMGITPKYHTVSIAPGEAQGVTAPVTQNDADVSPVTISLSVDAGVPLGEPTSPTHSLALTRQDERRLTLVLAGERNIPNKDFVLRYEVAADHVQAAAWVSADQDADYALITALPPRLDLKAEPEPREFIFVIDRSGSMSGGPIEQARNALRACLRALGARDTFAMLAFDNHVEWFTPAAQPITQPNVDAADQWINGVDARGGTEIYGALTAALGLPHDAERQRYIVFLTDGAVSDDERMMREVAKKRGGARIFTFGVGPSVNRALLNKMAQLGRGAAEFLTLKQDIEQAMTRFQDRVSYPALQEVALTWEGAESWDAYPDVLPDLYVGQPLDVVTRLKRTGTTASALKITGKRGGQPVSLRVEIPASTDNNPTIKRLWARERIESLLDSGRRGAVSDQTRQQIIGLALAHRLVTPYTSFVAIDSEVTTGGPSRQIEVAVPLPEGLDFEGFFGSGIAFASGYIGGAGPASTLGMMSFSAFAPPDASAKPRRASGRAQPRAMLSKASEDAEPDAGLSDAIMSAPDMAPLPMTPLPKSAAPSMPASMPASMAASSLTVASLAREQNVSGSWGGGDSEAEMTAAALLAFVREGHTTRAGNYRRQVLKAAQWLRGALPNARGFAAFAAFRALTELDAADGLSGADRFAPDALHDPSYQLPASAPASIQSLDDLRAVALMAGEASAPSDLAGDPHLIMTWRAVGAPR